MIPFSKTPVSAFAVVEPVGRELYGTTTWVVDSAKLRAIVGSQMLADTLPLAQARVDAANEAARFA